jgi:hypothetical protein
MTSRQQWIVVAAIVGVLAAGLGAASYFMKDQLFPVTIGSEMPNFKAKVLGENRYKSFDADYKGQVVLLNVWGIIWPNNKRILAATAGTGPAAPPELARQAFIASRTNAWLSLPMLLFMATSHGDWVAFGR